mgnify:CR=1 FL=1
MLNLLRQQQTLRPADSPVVPVFIPAFRVFPCLFSPLSSVSVVLLFVRDPWIVNNHPVSTLRHPPPIDTLLRLHAIVVDPLTLVWRGKFLKTDLAAEDVVEHHKEYVVSPPLLLLNPGI